MSVKSFTALAGAVCACVSGLALAANHHDEMIVTASRAEQSLDSVLAPVTVINRQQIEKSQANTVYDLLRQVPGVQLARRGGKGGSSGLFIRGTNSGHVLVLVDGVRFESATTGEVAIESLGIDQIERIEVVRSPRSSLYGSDAIGGVIQIFTRRGAAQSETAVTLGYGSENTRELGVRTTLAYKKGSVALAANRSSTDGIDVQYADDEWTGNNTFDLDKDESEARDISLKWLHRIADGVSLDWSTFYSVDEAHYDETRCAVYDANWNCVQGLRSLPFSESQNAKTSVGVDYDVTADWGMRVQVAYALDDLVTRNEVSALDSKDQIKTERFHHFISNDVRISDDQQVAFGVDYIKDLVEGDVAYGEDQRENLGTYVQYMLQSGKASLSVGGRYDDNGQFGGHETGNIALGWTFDPALEAILSFGTAFKAPTFNDLYWPNAGNPDLEPEESKNIELQFRGDLSAASYYEVNFFRNEIDNLIEWAPIAPGSFTWRPQNVAEARIEGVELLYQVQASVADFGFNLTYMEPKDLTEDEDLRRRSRLVGSIDVVRSGEQGLIGLTAHGVSEKKGAENLPGYGTLDIRFERRFGENLTARLKVENLFDKEIVQVEKYNDQGRYALFEVEYRLAH